MSCSLHRGGRAHAVDEKTLETIVRAVVETLETIVRVVVARGSTCISFETVSKGVKHYLNLPEYCFADYQEI